MADTIQIVRWTLEQQCPLRREEAVTEPGPALAALSRAHGIARRQSTDRRTGLYGDILVVGYTSSNPFANRREKTPPFPCIGFDVSETLAAVGGIDGLQSLCRNCPANATSPKAVGCVGTLYQYAGSEETEEQLRSIITRLGLLADVRDELLETTPIWYGLWAKPTPSRRGVQALVEIMTAMRAEDAADDEVDEDQLRDFSNFIRAARLALARGVMLHVDMAPPGHTDFGYYTVFPHCPRCKAEARVRRWRRIPAALYTCHACGMQYSPKEMSRSEKDSFPPELRDVLGPERFARLAVEYLVANSDLSPAQAAELVVKKEAEHQARVQKLEVERAANERRWAAQTRFEIEQLFVGLRPIYPEPEGGEEEEGLKGTQGSPTFNLADFQELLRRCRRLGIRITSMRHEAPEDPAPGQPDMDRYSFREIDDPEKVLQHWVMEGCAGRFNAWLIVPNHLLAPYVEQTGL